MLFSWGGNRHGILGQGNNTMICFPRKVNLFNVQKISSDGLSSYFLTNEGSIYYCNSKTQKTPKIIETKNNLTNLLYIYCCDSESMFYELNGGEYVLKGKFESFDEFLAKEQDKTLKIVSAEKKKLEIFNQFQLMEDEIRNSGTFSAYNFDICVLNLKKIFRIDEIYLFKSFQIFMSKVDEIVEQFFKRMIILPVLIFYFF